MRVEKHKTVEEAAASLSRLMDDFAAVSMHGSGTAAIGGYRVIHAARPHQPRPVAAHRNTRRAPIRMTGTLVALFISSLGVAAFSGPATCPSCGKPSVTVAAEQPTTPGVSRFAYAHHNVARAYRAVQHGPIDLASVEPQTLPEARSPKILDVVEMAAAGEPVETSPISTSAIEPAQRAQPTVVASNNVELEDVGPRPIRLTATTPVEIQPVVSPEIEVATLPMSEVAEADVEAEAETVPAAREEPVAHAEHTVRRHATSKRRTVRAYRSVVESRESKRKRLANIPTWAEKMFVPDWQSRAFNY